MKTTKKYTLSLTLLLAILLSVAVVPATAKKRDNSAENSRKAEYIYMEALRQNALNNTDSYFELLNRAYQLDPNNSDVGFFLGYYQMVLAKNDTIMPAKGYKLTADYGLEEPANVITLTVGTENISINVGDENEILSLYYVNTSASDEIYLVDNAFPLKFDATIEELTAEE